MILCAVEGGDSYMYGNPYALGNTITNFNVVLCGNIHDEVPRIGHRSLSPYW